MIRTRDFSNTGGELTIQRWHSVCTGSKFINSYAQPRNWKETALWKYSWTNSLRATSIKWTIFKPVYLRSPKYCFGLHDQNVIKLTADCPQCYCGEIREMLKLHINPYCPKAYHSPDHPETTLTGTRTQDSVGVTTLLKSLPGFEA
jgi:hypothetical protein